MGVCGVYRKMRVTRSIFYFLMKRLEHTSMQKERGIEKEAWFQEKEGLIHGVWPLEDSGGGVDPASRGRNYSGLKEALSKCLLNGSDQNTEAFLERKPIE